MKWDDKLNLHLSGWTRNIFHLFEECDGNLNAVVRGTLQEKG